MRDFITELNLCLNKNQKARKYVYEHEAKSKFYNYTCTSM